MHSRAGYNYDSTSIRRPFDRRSTGLSDVVKVTVTSHWPIYLFIYLGRRAFAQYTGRNVGRRIFVARSNCSQMEDDWRSNRSRVEYESQL